MSDQVPDEDWVLVAAPQSAASEAPDDGATVATAATAATVPPTTSHEEAVARGQLMAATASAEAAEVRPFDRLPDDGLAKVLAILKQSEHRRVESVCQRWRQIRPRASLARASRFRLRERSRSSARPRPVHQPLHPSCCLKDTVGEGYVDSGDT